MIAIRNSRMEFVSNFPTMITSGVCYCNCCWTNPYGMPRA